VCTRGRELNYIVTHWVSISAILMSIWISVRESFNKIANSLPAPTATSSDRYIWWFKFSNSMAGNKERANNTSIENSPNFIPAAEKYMAEKLAQK